MEGCTVESNTAAGSGAGVCSRGKLTVKGGKYTGNTAGDFGGGICVTDDDNASISISGALEVHDNKGGKGDDLYLAMKTTARTCGSATAATERAAPTTQRTRMEIIPPSTMSLNGRRSS